MSKVLGHRLGVPRVGGRPPGAAPEHYVPSDSASWLRPSGKLQTGTKRILGTPCPGFGAGSGTVSLLAPQDQSSESGRWLTAIFPCSAVHLSSSPQSLAVPTCDPGLSGAPVPRLPQRRPGDGWVRMIRTQGHQTCDHWGRAPTSAQAATSEIAVTAQKTAPNSHGEALELFLRGHRAPRHRLCVSRSLVAQTAPLSDARPSEERPQEASPGPAKKHPNHQVVPLTKM